MATKKPLKKVIVTTEHRGVFYGSLASYDGKDRVAQLDDALMVIQFGTTRGLLQLAATGPTTSSNLSDTAPSMRLEKCVSIIDVSKEAEAAWAARTKR